MERAAAAASLRQADVGGEAPPDCAIEHIEGIFRIYGEGLEKIGEPRTPWVLRAILDRVLLPEIEEYVGTVKAIYTHSIFRTEDWRVRLSERLAACEEEVETHIEAVSDLKETWTDAIEAEARELEFARPRHGTGLAEAESGGGSDDTDAFWADLERRFREL